jgi:hypothetical protein
LAPTSRRCSTWLSCWCCRRTPVRLRRCQSLIEMTSFGNPGDPLLVRRWTVEGLGRSSVEFRKNKKFRIARRTKVIKKSLQSSWFSARMDFLSNWNYKNSC